MITVFYDGKCGLCRREIEYYKRIAREGRFHWIDITTMPEPFTQRGYRVGDGLLALHVEDDTGYIHKGVKAFTVIWHALPPFWSLLARLVELPILLPLAEKLYATFAIWRFKKLGYDSCKI